MFSAGPLSIVADIGGTNARFALSNGVELSPISYLAVADHPDPISAVKEFLGQIEAPAHPKKAAFAIAGPVQEGRGSLTNGTWFFDQSDLARSLNLDQALVVNDFAAVAMSLPYLAGKDLRQMGGGHVNRNAPMAVLGPGTGLGVGGLVPCGEGWQTIVTEGGHVTMPAVTHREVEVIKCLASHYGHVSAERLLSGQGLGNLFSAIAEVDGLSLEAPAPDVISKQGLDGSCGVASECLTMFCGMLGTVAGNLALSMGAQGGVFIAGGIVPRMADFWAASNFRQRFEAKGRFQDYMARIATNLVTHSDPAFLGLSVGLRDGSQ
ncbi:MAG: glucokinase [Pseudomonadota bacterium]